MDTTNRTTTLRSRLDNRSGSTTTRRGSTGATTSRNTGTSPVRAATRSVVVQSANLATSAERRTGSRAWDDSAEVTDLVQAVAQGDDRAWAELVRRYQGLVASVAARHGLGPTERADVCQATWVRLFNAAGRLEEPHRIGAWLVTTARRESLRVLTGSARRREAPGGLVPDEHRLVGTASGMVEAPLLRLERQQQVRRAVDQIPGRPGAVLRLLMDDDLSYAEVARRVGIAPGSVGPLRNRAIRRLRSDRRLAPLAGAA